MSASNQPNLSVLLLGLLIAMAIGTAAGYSGVLDPASLPQKAGFVITVGVLVAIGLVISSK
jgi:hypothetical protein